MARAVFSMSASGRRLARTTATPTMASATTMIALTSRSILASQPTVSSMLARLEATTRMTFCEPITCPVPPLVRLTVISLVMTCQFPLPEMPPTVASAAEFALSQAAVVGTSGPGMTWPEVLMGPNGGITCPFMLSSSTRNVP